MVIFMKKVLKISTVLIIIIMLIFISSNTFALYDDLDKYKPGDPTSEEAKEFTNRISIVLGAIRNIGIITSVISLMIIGVKYILGSVEEKSKYKETLLPWVIGCIILAMGTSLVSFIYDSVHKEDVVQESEIEVVVCARK